MVIFGGGANGLAGRARRARVRAADAAALRRDAPNHADELAWHLGISKWRTRALLLHLVTHICANVLYVSRNQRKC